MKEIIELLKHGQQSIGIKGKIQSSTDESIAMEGLLVRLIAVHSVMAEFITNPAETAREAIHIEWVKFVNFASSMKPEVFLYLYQTLVDSKTVEVTYWYKGEVYKFPKLYLVASVRIGVSVIVKLSKLATSYAIYSDAWAATESGSAQPYETRHEAVKKLVYITLMGMAPKCETVQQAAEFLSTFEEQLTDDHQPKRMSRLNKLKNLFTWRRQTI